MQIVIDIDEKIYNDIRSKNEHGKIFNAVKNGTPLPKGHGRLIDADAEITEIMKIKEMAKSSYDVYDGQIACLRLAKTIIEAENEEEE